MQNDLEELKKTNVMKSMVTMPFLQARHSVTPFPRMRNFVLDAGWQGRNCTLINIPFEVDVTASREFIEKYKKERGESLSFTTFILLCYVKTIDENRLFHSLRRGRRLVDFE